MVKKIIKIILLSIFMITLFINLNDFAHATMINFSSSQTICGVYEYDEIIINNSAVLTVCDYAGVDDGNGTVTFIATDFTMEAGTSIVATGKGYRGGAYGRDDAGQPGEGLGGGTSGVSSAGGGGAYGGSGGRGCYYTSGSYGFGGAVYGGSTNVTSMGSGGAGADGWDGDDGADGGGLIIINVSNTVIINGTIIASGDDAVILGGGNRRDGGGGSGGGIRIISNYLYGNGTILAEGGETVDCAYPGATEIGGGGGGGRIYIQTCNNNSNFITSADLGEKGDCLSGPCCIGGGSATDGVDGTIAYGEPDAGCFSVATPSISPSVAYNNDSLNCSVVVTNLNGVSNTQFRWYNNSVLVSGLDYNTSCVSGSTCYSSVGYLNNSQFDNWTCSVRANYSGEVLDWVNSSVRFINNSIPTSSNPIITSTDLTSYYDLTCVNSTIYDADVAEGDDTLTITWDWYRSTDDITYTSTGFNDNVLGKGNLSDQDYWKCLFYVDDGHVTSVNYTSAASYISQYISAVSISPATAYNDDTLNCSATFQYVSGSINGQFKWYNNTVYQPQFDSNTSCTSGSACYSTIGINPLNTTQFDNWTCSVAGNSSGVDVEWVNSSVRFINNTIPTSTNPTISPGGPVNTDDLICVNNSIDDVDVDEGDDTLTITWDWYNSSDGVTYVSTGINDNNLTSDNLSTGSYWKCLFYVDDGHSTTINYTSGPVFVTTPPQSAPIINSGNASYSGVITLESTPANNNTQVDFQYRFSDVESDSGKLYVCSTDSFNVVGGCTATEYCNSGTNYPVGAINCTVSDLSVFPGTSTTVYAFVNSSVSSLYSNSFSTAVHVNHFPEGTPSITSFNNGTSYGSGQATVSISWSALTDDDSDTINYTVYYSVDNDDPDTILVNSDATSYLWSVNPNADYYWKVQTVDEHGYLAPVNSTVYTFNVDAASVGGGGGGAGEHVGHVVTRDVVYWNESCNDNFCDNNENFLNCIHDCVPIIGNVMGYDVLCLRERCMWDEPGFVKSVIVLGLLGSVFFFIFFKRRKR